MKSIIKKDSIIGVFLVVLGIGFSLINSKLGVDMTFKYPGPKLFPYIGTFGLMICGSGMVIKDLKNKKKDDEKFLPRKGWFKLMRLYSVLILFFVGLKYLGYLITAPIALCALTLMFVEDKDLKLGRQIIFSLIFVFLVYISYIKFFGMQLPKGIIF